MSSAATTAAPANDVLGYGFAIAGSVLFATKGIFIKLAYGYGVSTEILLALRMLVALPVYLLILVTLLRRNPELRARLTLSILLPSMLVGILGYYISSYLDFAALNYITAQYGRLVLFTYPFFVVLFGALFFGQRFDWRMLPGMFIAYLGLMLIFGWSLAETPDGLMLGTALVLTAAVTFAFYQLLAKRQIGRLGSGFFTCIAMSTAAVCALAHAGLSGGVAAFEALDPMVWVLGLGLGIFATVLPSFFMNAAIDRVGPRANSATAALGPVVTTIFAALLLSEPFTLYHAAGTALVILGSTLFGRAERQARHRKS